MLITKFYLTEQIKRDEGAGRVEGFGKGRGCTVFGVEM